MSYYLKRLASVEIDLVGTGAPGAEFWLLADLQGIEGDLSCCGWTVVDDPEDDAFGGVLEVEIPAGHERAYVEFEVCERHWPRRSGSSSRQSRR